MDNLESEIILETERNNMRFQKERPTLKNKFEKLTTMSYENNKIHAGNLEKKNGTQDSIIDQLLLDHQKVSTQCNCCSHAEVSVDYQELA